MNIKYKRILSYIIDITIIFIIMCIINNLFSNNLELNILNEEYFEKIITFNEYIENYKIVIHQIDKQNIIINIMSIILTIISFVVIPFLCNGQTLGMKLFKIKINKPLLNKILIRSLIINGLGYMTFMLIILYLVNDNLYFILMNLLSFLQIIVVIISVFMVLYRKDQRGLHDILSKTEIEELK